MDTIKSYLENMFQALPKTEEILRLKNELLSNMEEKYQELKGEGKTENEAIGTVIAEFGNIDELLKEMEINTSISKEALPAMSLTEAREFITLKKRASQLIGTGVALIMFGVSVLVLLSQLVENRLIFSSFPNGVQDTLPVIFLFLMIVPAVSLFIYSGIKLERFKFIDEGQFELDSSTKAILSKELSDFLPKKTMGIIIGVCLCILSPVAVLVGSLFGNNGASFGASILLIIIAIAVFIFVNVGSTTEAYNKLLKSGDYSPVRKKENKLIGAVAALVWPIATSIFLVSGLVFNLWYICWIVFPITGVLFGAFSAFYSAMRKER